MSVLRFYPPAILVMFGEKKYANYRMGLGIRWYSLCCMSSSVRTRSYWCRAKSNQSRGAQRRALCHQRARVRSSRKPDGGDGTTTCYAGWGILDTLGRYVAHLCGDTCSSRWQSSAELRMQRRDGYWAWSARDN